MRGRVLGSQHVPIERVEVSVYEVPTDAPESDGTIEWNATTVLVVQLHAGGSNGLGYAYGHAAAASLVRSPIEGRLIGADAMDVGRLHEAMVHAVRNIGSRGVAANAISATDAALWDLKARLLGVPLYKLLGAARDAVPVYGSGGFTSYDDRRLREQLGGWAHQGISMVKMKVGREPHRDVSRVETARESIGPHVQLFVDANGAYSVKQALALAEAFAEFGVTWFEEPVSSDDLEGLHLLRERAPAGMDIAAGEYGFEPYYFRRMLDAQAVDVLQADATRCRGVTGFLHAIALCEAFGLPLSAHTSPTLHGHVACANSLVRHVEYFHDHARIERLLFDGALEPVGGALHPDATQPGLGLTLKRRDAERFAA